MADPDLPAARHRERLYATAGQYYLTGWDVLVRLPVMRALLDQQGGRDTRGFVSGYPGSPFGGLDSLLRREHARLGEHGVHFEPGVNEELAATAIQGTQYLNLGSVNSRHDGVFGLWYGKGPGVERATDAIRTSSYLGTSPHGGVLAFAGDDHDARSTVTAQQSDTLFVHMHMPILNPATLQELIDFSILGWDLSRFASTWVGIPCLNDLADTASTCHVDLDRFRTVIPDDVMSAPPLGTPRPGAGGVFGAAGIEVEIIERRLPAAEAFVRANAMDRIVAQPTDHSTRRIGIVTAGQAYLDVLSALRQLRLDLDDLAPLGVGLYKPAMTWPLEPRGLLEFASGYDEILVIEPKAPIIEDQVARLLRQLHDRPLPVVSGKVDPTGRSLVPRVGALDSSVVRRVLRERLTAHDVTTAQEPIALSGGSLSGMPLPLARTAGFCSGCPHSTSTRVPDGSVALAGTGCHCMAMNAPVPGRETEFFTQMGGEGALWLGMAPFTDQPHVFQNMGDGTYHHSGHLAVRAAVAAGVSMTFKILLNGYISMTGGQTTPSEMTAETVSRQVLAEGAVRAVVVTDDLSRFGRSRRRRFPRGVRIHDRRDLLTVEEELKQIEGVTVLIYDQPCAAELRRERSRGRAETPSQRVFINAAVCEGCGDCNIQSNCISVEPLDTDLGRKRMIKQSSCNFDMTCLDGYCPSFVTVSGGRPRRDVASSELLTGRPLPDPGQASIDSVHSTLVCGIGGGGVLTIGAILGMAAHLDGLGVTVLNESGLAQKNGAVHSHIRITPSADHTAPPRVDAGSADVILGADAVTAASKSAAQTARAGTWVLLNETVSPTVAFAGEPGQSLSVSPMMRTFNRILGSDPLTVDATDASVRLLGDAIYANLFLLGYAAQAGQLPVRVASIREAIGINAVAVEQNLQAFELGRHFGAGLKTLPAPSEPASDESLAALLARRHEALVAYQNEGYARRFDEVIAQVRQAVPSDVENPDRLVRAVAESLFKTMSYKDEYEVARLYRSPEFRRSLAEQFEGRLRIKVNLAPQLLNRRDPRTGHARKWAIPGWLIMPGFAILSAMRRLRGTPFDVFGMTRHRRQERARVARYIDLVESEVLPRLNANNFDLAVEICASYQQIKGYDTIKDANADQVEEQLDGLLAALAATEPHRV